MDNETFVYVLCVSNFHSPGIALLISGGISMSMHDMSFVRIDFHPSSYKFCKQGQCEVKKNQMQQSLFVCNRFKIETVVQSNGIRDVNTAETK